jgi:phospholipase C
MRFAISAPRKYERPRTEHPSDYRRGKHRSYVEPAFSSQRARCDQRRIAQDRQADPHSYDEHERMMYSGKLEFANEHDGRSYPIHHLDSTSIADDPDHSASSVDLQIGGGAMDGFVTSFAGTLSRRGVEDGDPARVMGYYNAADVPVYDHLAREFAVCDRWFSSVPGATWPNRLYAICGRAAGSRDDLPHNLPPLYNQPSFVRHLDADGITWRWYSFEGGTLRFADAHYALGHHDRFAFFSRTNLNWKARLEVRIDTQAASFLEDAARGTPPSVSWIDPNFSNFNPIGFQPNDDHAPADIKDSQEFVLAVYHALAASPQWEKTLLVIFYDEDGGFFDHVAPGTRATWEHEWRTPMISESCSPAPRHGQPRTGTH